MIIIYDISCTPCTRKEYAKRAKKYAAQERELIRFINVASYPEHRAEIEHIDESFPFATKDGEVIQI